MTKHKGPEVVEKGAPAGRRLRRIVRRRREILAAAARVFANKGFARATTREIADEADVAEGTLYNYFGGKRQILAAMAEEVETPLEIALAEVAGKDDREAATALFEAMFDAVEARATLLRAVLSEAWVDDELLEQIFASRLARVEQILQGYIRTRIEAGVFRPFDPELGARVVIGMYFGLMLPVIRGIIPLPPPDQRRALSETLTSLLFDGILLHPGPISGNPQPGT